MLSIITFFVLLGLLATARALVKTETCAVGRLNMGGFIGAQEFPRTDVAETLVELLGRGLENALPQSKAPSVNRMLLNYHIDRVSSRFTDLKNCAEWSYKYIPKFKCKSRYTVKYEPDPKKFVFDSAKKIILASAEDFSLAVPHNFMELIIATQVFEHVSEPNRGLAEVYKVLAPGGYLLWTVPFNFRYHPYPGDFYRYSLTGARRLFYQHGFEIMEIYGLGDRALSFAEFIGLGSNHLPKHWFRRTSRDYPLNIWVIARKPLTAGKARPKIAPLRKTTLYLVRKIEVGDQTVWVNGTIVNHQFVPLNYTVPTGFQPITVTPEEEALAADDMDVEPHNEGDGTGEGETVMGLGESIGIGEADLFGGAKKRARARVF